MSVAIQFSVRNEKYLSTIKSLRLRNFGKDLPFLIVSDKLPEGQVYREFSDGHIELQEVYSVGAKFQHKVLRILSPDEAEKIRKEHGLL